VRQWKNRIAASCAGEAGKWRNNMNRLVSNMLSSHIGALKAAVLVGTVLNLVNHGEPLLQAAAISWQQLLLNYLGNL
jgi:hypothetical protein